MANQKEGQAFFYEIGGCVAIAAAIVKILPLDDKNNIIIYYRTLNRPIINYLFHKFKKRKKNWLM